LKDSYIFNTKHIFGKIFPRSLKNKKTSLILLEKKEAAKILVTDYKSVFYFTLYRDRNETKKAGIRKIIKT